MSVKEKTVTDNLTQKQRYKKFISKDTKISKVLNSEAAIFKVILYHDKSGCYVHHKFGLPLENQSIGTFYDK